MVGDYGFEGGINAWDQKVGRVVLCSSTVIDQIHRLRLTQYTGKLFTEKKSFAVELSASSGPFRLF